MQIILTKHNKSYIILQAEIDNRKRVNKESIKGIQNWTSHNKIFQEFNWKSSVWSTNTVH